MPQKVFILILVGSAVFAAWTFASPPSGTPGATSGALFSNSAGNIGIKTSSPATALDVNGTTTIRKSLDMANNRIINVATPTSSTDAVNKAYVDNQLGITTLGGAKVWGQGRPNTTVTNQSTTGQECTRAISGLTVKISRSVRTATWDGAAAVCPAGWWICSAADRGTAACGSGSKNVVTCDVGTGTNDLAATTYDGGWLADTSTSTVLERGMASRVVAGSPAEQPTCHILPVWCCAYQ